MRILNADEVKSVLDMRVCMDALEEAGRENALGAATSQRRRHIHSTVTEPDRLYRFKVFEGLIEKWGIAAIRINSDMMMWPVVDDVRRQEKVAAAPGERFVGQILVYQMADLRLLGLLSEGAIQLFRVGGTGGLSSKYMARADAKVVALYGSGQQARTQVLAHCEARKIELVKVYSPNPRHREAFAKEMASQVDAEMRVVDDPEEVAKGADILAVATNSRIPVVKAEWLEEGMHVTGVGAELDAAGRDRVDRFAQRDRRIHGFENAWTAQAKQTMSRLWPGYEKVYGAEISKGLTDYPELGEIILGKVPGRTNDKEITYFHTDTGLGIEFAAVGARVLERAEAQGVGTVLPDEWFSQKEHT